MRNKKIIIALIALLISLFIVILIIILNIINKNKEIYKENNLLQNENIVNQDYDQNVYYEENGVVYSSSGEPKDEINFKLEGIPDEIFNKYIKDKESFYSTMKTYVFSYGFNKKANTAKYNRFEYQKESNRIAIEFILDDNAKTTFVAIVNLKDETIEIVNK